MLRCKFNERGDASILNIMPEVLVNTKTHLPARKKYERQMDTTIVPCGYDFSKSKEKVSTISGNPQRSTVVSLSLPFKYGSPVSNTVEKGSTVIEIATMTSRTYLGRTRSFVATSDNENERQLDSVSYRNSRNMKKGNGNYLDDEPAQPYSINTVHLQNPYKPPQKLEGFTSRNTSFKVRSRFFQKSPHRSRDSHFRSRNNNLSTARREASTVKVNDVDDDKISSVRYRKRNIRLYMKRMELTETAKQYCSNSSLHGLRYIGDDNLTTLEKIFWFLAFVLAVMAAGYFINHLYDKWTDTPIIIAMSPEPMNFHQFPFPSVTVCNMNNVKKSEATRINKGDNSLDKLLLDDLCNFRNSNTVYDDEDYTKTNWNSLLQFMINVSQPCTTMLSVCIWHGNATDCGSLFNPTMTDEGICCNFNSVDRKYLFYDPREWSDLNQTFRNSSIDWNPETGYGDNTPPDTLPWRPYGAGKFFGLTLYLDAELHEYYCSSTVSAGFKMFLHNPVETPKIADFAFAISPGKETRVIIKPQITTAIHSILRVPRNKRRCYFTSERRLRYYRTYTQKNCLLECEANFTQKACSCVQSYMPKSSDTKICGKRDDQCADDAKRAMERKLYDEEIVVNQVNITETPSCNCWPGCFEMNYASAMSSTPLSSRFEIDTMYLQKAPEYFTENMAVVHLFFADSQFPNYVKSELFGFIEFLSSTGGLLGLFMGFSFLSVAEIVYFMTIRVWCRLHGNHGRIQVLPAIHNKKVIYPFAQ